MVRLITGRHMRLRDTELDVTTPTADSGLFRGRSPTTASISQKLRHAKATQDTGNNRDREQGVPVMVGMASERKYSSPKVGRESFLPPTPRTSPSPETLPTTTPARKRVNSKLLASRSLEYVCLSSPVRAKGRRCCWRNWQELGGTQWNRPIPYRS